MREDAPVPFEGKVFRTLINRVAYIGLAIFFITYATSLWSRTGYLDLGMLVITWLLLILAGISLIYSAIIRVSRPGIDYVFLTLLLVGMTAYFVALVSIFPTFGTDELALDTYAAYLTLHGVDPYVSSNMIRAFSFYHVPFYFVTPVLTGGYVHYMTYPGLSVLLMVPAVLAGVHSNYTLIAFSLASYPLLFYYYRKKNFIDLFPYATFVLLVNFNWVYYTVGGVTDIVWLFFLALSYIYRDRPGTAGMLYGLSISFKQTPAAIFPFFLYFIYMEKGKDWKAALTFSLYMAASFLITNAPFIVMNPSAWFTSVAGVASQPIIGIGLGPSILAFAGFVTLARFVFLVLPVLILAAFFVLYVTGFERYKFAFFAFPVLAFVFYYRVLLNYLIYWPFLLLLLLPDIVEQLKSQGLLAPVTRTDLRRAVRAAISALRDNRLAASLVALIVIGGAIVTGLGYAAAGQEPLKIVKIDAFGNPYSVPGMITSMNVTVSYTPQNGQPVNIPVFFRILVNGPVVSANGMLWSAQNPYVSPGVNTLRIIPNTPIDYVQSNTSFRLIAYYDNFQSVFSSAGGYAKQAFLIANPLMLNAALYNMTSPIGWHFSVSGQGTGHYNYSPGQISIIAGRNTAAPGWVSAQMTNDNINLTALAAENAVLDFRLNITGPAGSEGSSLGPTGRPHLFFGAEFTFEYGSKSLWIGYNSTASATTSHPDANMVVMLTNSTGISFRTAYDMALQNGWSVVGATFMYLAGSLTYPNPVSATFGGFSIGSA